MADTARLVKTSTGEFLAAVVLVPREGTTPLVELMMPNHGWMDPRDALALGEALVEIAMASVEK